MSMGEGDIKSEDDGIVVVAFAAEMLLQNTF
jgi:hypothetical protein